MKNVEAKKMIPSLIILLTIIGICLYNLKIIQDSIGAVYDACIANFGWFFIIADLCCLVFSLWIMLGPYRDIRLGGESCKPIFSTASWAGMMFTTSCGAWLIVYGFLEPIYCSAQAPFQLTPLSTQAYEFGQAYAHFHWGPNAWCIYVPISIAIGYVLYNRGNKEVSISGACGSLLNKKSGKLIGNIVDIISICGVVIAPIISIGTGMPLLVALVEKIFGVSDEYSTILSSVILCVWICIFGISVFLGLNKGIKRLSNINVTIAFILMVVVGLITGVSYVMSSEINTLGVLLNNYLRMNTYTDAFGSGSFVRGWTVSYWACYFVYMPLMGVFNAKISKGRRLKEIAFGQLILCTLGCWVAMGTFGNLAMKYQTSGVVDVAAFLENGNEVGAMMAILNNMPFSKLMLIILLVISFIFLATTMDSSAFAAAEMTAKMENDESLAPRWLRITWAVVASALAFTLLRIGGVKAVRSLCYLMGLPLAVVSFLVMASAIKMLRKDHASDCESDKPLTIFKKD